MRFFSRSTFWERCADFTVRFSRPVLATILVLTLFFLASLVRLERGTHVKYFHTDEARDLTDTVEEKFDEGRYASIIFEAQGKHSLLEPELLKHQFRVLQAIREHFTVNIDSLVEGIDAGLKRVKRKSLLEVDEYTDIAEAILGLAGDRTVYDLERVSHHLLSDPVIVEFYEKFRILSAMMPSNFPGGSQRTYGMPYLKAVKSYIQLDSSLDVEGQKKDVVAIRNLVTPYQTEDLKIYMYAEDLVSHDIDANSKKNALIMGLILFFFDTLLLWIIFRGRREVYLSFLILVTACIWTFGTASLFGIDISFLHLLVLPILLGTGADDIVVFGKRLAEERKKNKRLEVALRETYAATGNSIFLTTLTTFLAFLSGALISDIQGVASFFFLISLSMVYIFIITVLLEGSLRSVLEIGEPKESRLASTVLKHAEQILTYLPRTAAKMIGRYSGHLLRYSILLALFALAVGLRIETEFERKIFMTQDMPTYLADQKEDEYFGRSDAGYILIEGDVVNYELLQKMRRLEESMGRYPAVEKILKRANVESINELLKKMRLTLKPESDIGATFDFISKNEQTANYALDETFSESFRHLVHKSNDQYDALLMKFFVEGAMSKEVQDLADHLWREVQRLGIDKIKGIRVRIGGGEISSDLEQHSYFVNMIETFYSSLMINFIVLLIAWRRLSHALLAIVPIVLSTSLTLGVMILFQVKLNVLNLTLGMIIVGLGIDYPIHIIERFKEERHRQIESGQVSPEEAVQAVLSRMGPNIFGAALTTIVGFAAAMVMAMPIAQSFGLLISLAIFLAYLASIFVLPVVLVKLGREG